MNKYSPVIGLEIHVELKTKSKMFCQCSANYFGMPPNSNTCPVCLGMPGALPVPNKKAIEFALMIGKALNCRINNFSKFDRKHYFYPDLPKGYQISQYDQPLSVNGKVVIANAAKQSELEKLASSLSAPRNDKKEIGITRVHLEEDTGKLLHVGSETLVDFNRSGVPLVEIVTDPDFDNAENVKRFLEELQAIIRYLDVSDADMEKGSMRLEPNISVRKITNDKLKMTNKLPNYKVEVKNINSFKFVKQAIEFEVERQTEILEKGETPRQETRGFDEKKQITYSQRSKEEAHDYRYFPEPDIPPMEFTVEYLKSLFANFPRLPQEALNELVSQGVKPTDAFILTRNKSTVEFLDKVLLLTKGKLTPQSVANLIINKRIPLTPNVGEFVAKSLQLVAPKETDVGVLSKTIGKVISSNQKVVDDYKVGKVNAIMFLVGQVMREMKGQADAKLVISKIKDQIAKSQIKN